MNWLRQACIDVRVRARAIFRRQSMRARLEEEMRLHVEMREERLVGSGVAPAEARRQARREFGNIAVLRDSAADMWKYGTLERLLQDLRYAARLLTRNPVFTLTASLSLAIGIGATTTIFSIANAVLFRDPIAVGEPARLVDIGVSRNGRGFGSGSDENYADIARRVTTLEGVYAYSRFPAAMSLDRPAAEAETAFGTPVSLNYFTLLRAVPAAGRLFTPADGDGPGADAVVLSHSFWSRRFNQDAGVVGRTLSLNGQSHLVIGVAAEGFQGTGIRAPDLWLPLLSLGSRGGATLVMGGRLKPGVSLLQAAAELDAIGRALAQEYPAENAQSGLRVASLSQVPGESAPITAFLAFLMVIVGLVLAIACANVSGVLVARATERRREIAMRLAIGAGRSRIVRQLLTETMLLFALGATAGLALARVMTALLVSRLPSLPFPIGVSIVLDGRVIAFATMLSLVAAVVSGLTPALQASKADVLPSLKEETPTAFGRLRLRHALVVAQVALSLLLVVVAGLFVQALRQVSAIDPGFDVKRVELASIDFSLAGHGAAAAPLAARDLLERVRALPSVEAATIAAVIPGGFESIELGPLSPAGAAIADNAQQSPIAWNIVEPGYFATLRMPILAGRDFGPGDRNGAEPVVIVGDRVARTLWPGQDAVGRLVQQRRWAPGGQTITQTFRVIGVARDAKFGSLVDGTSGLFAYLPLQQEYIAGFTTIVARARHDERLTGEIRRLVASTNPRLSIKSFQTAENYVALGLVPQRVAGSVAGSLGLVGLLLASMGIYGLTAYGVARRTREIGIRLALGAQPRDVVRLVVRQGMSLTAIGAAIGLVLALGAGRLLAGFLFGVSSADPGTLGGAAALFMLTGILACYLPVRRAMRIGAMDALRHD